ncbi:MAG: diguanylate cyclase [Oscillospiraceae bacterium]|nr:diguanylate cyclase [Oscillospiraceae bacterium]
MKHILVVDDNKTNLASARSVLTSRYKVTAVTSGAQALKFLEGHTVDLILLDINMPEMNGFEVMDKIRKSEKWFDIPIIFLTADSDSQTESRCLEEGAVDFIVKPFVPNVMCSRIGRTLELEDLRKSLAEQLSQKMQEVTDIKSKSCQDALTGLWNRAYTEEQANLWLKETKSGALIMIDMDNFKAINDNYGHIAGDHTLKMFAETLQEYSFDEDVLCRIGGDEFVVFVKNDISKQALANRAADIISDLCRKLEEYKFETNSSVSIGIAEAPSDGTEFNTLYNAADKALYYVKQNGKNSYHFFSEQHEKDSERASKLVDLEYLQEMMSRTDSQRGAYMMDFDSFRHVYNFVRRFVERGEHKVQTILFTLSMKDGISEEVTEIETAVDMLDQAIFTSLRRADISTRYSSKQIIVILLDVRSESCDMIANRIINCFKHLYIGERIIVEYDVAQLEKLPGTWKRREEDS